MRPSTIGRPPRSVAHPPGQSSAAQANSVPTAPDDQRCVGQPVGGDGVVGNRAGLQRHPVVAVEAADETAREGMHLQAGVARSRVARGCRGHESGRGCVQLRGPRVREQRVAVVQVCFAVSDDNIERDAEGRRAAQRHLDSAPPSRPGLDQRRQPTGHSRRWPSVVDR